MTGELIRKIEGHTTALVWDTAARGLIRKVEGHIEPILSIAFSMDGKTLASCSRDKTLIMCI